jgi:hypothetical protein
LTAKPKPPIAAALGASATPGLALTGFEPVPETLETGQTLNLAFWWDATQSLPAWRERIFLRGLPRVDRDLFIGAPVHDSLPFASWKTPTFLIDRQRVRIPVSLAPGPYQLHLVVANDSGAVVLSQKLGDVDVQETQRLFAVPSVDEAVDVTVGAEIRLLGANREGDSLSLVWQAQMAPTADYSVFVHVLDADGRCCLWQADGWPVGGAYPTSRWLPQEVVLDDYAVSLPPETPPGDYPLEVGLYLADTGRRLRVVGPDGAEGDAILLAPWIAQ